MSDCRMLSKAWLALNILHSQWFQCRKHITKLGHPGTLKHIGTLNLSINSDPMKKETLLET